ncbi:MAG TPA: hypothetical protein VFI95_22000 [Terriglobales bacterium]|nr:hypothetical protein [Terriglobales bacterium]
MFEQEIELEKSESSVVPLLLIVCLIVSIVGLAGYYVWQNKKVLSNAEAGNVISESLNMHGPATVRFHVGMVKASVAERPDGPHYRLLEKAGVVKLGKGNGRVYPIAMTSDGEKLLSALPGVTKTKEKDNTDLYVVPLAERRLIEISKVTMNSASRATVDYVWKWEPNKLGNLFDASGSLVKSFNTWDRATLIDKYGANFYHADPSKVQVVMIKADRGIWRIAQE